MRETRSKEIAGRTYEVTQLGAVAGQKVFVRVLKVLGPAIGAKDMAALLGGIQESDVQALVDAFIPMTHIAGVGQLNARTFDDHFAGAYRELFDWLAFCVEVNFGDFLSAPPSGLAASVGSAPAVEKGVSRSTSLPIAIGPSGE